MTSATDLTKIPKARASWGAHWANLVAQAAAFVAVAVHPGWHPPAFAAHAVAVDAPAGVIAVLIVVIVSDHHLQKVNLTAAMDWLSKHAGAFVAAARELAPIVDTVPGLSGRVADVETLLSNLPSSVLDGLAALRIVQGPSAASAAPQDPSAADPGPPAAWPAPLVPAAAPAAP